MMGLDTAIINTLSRSILTGEQWFALAGPTISAQFSRIRSSSDSTPILYRSMILSNMTPMSRVSRTIGL